MTNFLDPRMKHLVNVNIDVIVSITYALNKVKTSYTAMEKK